MNGSVNEQAKSSIHTIPHLNDSNDWSATIGEKSKTTEQKAKGVPFSH